MDTLVDLSGKVFFITFKLDYSIMFCKSNVNKTVRLFLVLLKHREIITVKIVKLCKKLYFFHQKS